MSGLTFTSKDGLKTMMRSNKNVRIQETALRHQAITL